MIVPRNFNGKLFCQKTGLNKSDWHLEADGTIRAPIEVSQDLLDECSKPIITIDDFKNAIEDLEQSYAISLDYITWDRLLSHINSPEPTWRKDGEIAWMWKTEVDKRAYEILSEVQLGKRPIPSVEDFIKLLPRVPT